MKVLPRSAHVFKKDKIEQQNPGDKQAKNLEAFTALFDVLLKWNYHAWVQGVCLDHVVEHGGV